MSRKPVGLFLLSLGLLIVWSGCSSRKVTTSAEDQNLLQKQGVSTQSVPAGSSAPSDATRVIESVIASPLSPTATSEAVAQPSPASPSQSHPSQMAPAASLPAGALGDVFFDYDRFMLRNEARSTLEEDARWLKGQNGVKVLIEGHCDERGTLAYNLVLGERRAQSVKRYLQDLGIPPSQLQTTSYGKERPFCQEHGEACWQQNRRAHFMVR